MSTPKPTDQHREEARRLYRNAYAEEPKDSTVEYGALCIAQGERDSILWALKRIEAMRDAMLRNGNVDLGISATVAFVTTALRFAVMTDEEHHEMDAFIDKCLNEGEDCDVIDIRAFIDKERGE